MSTAAMPPTQVVSAPHIIRSASILSAPHRAAQHEGSSSNLGTFGVRQAIYHL
jgi:hypothetical protein